MKKLAFLIAFVSLCEIPLSIRAAMNSCAEVDCETNCLQNGSIALSQITWNPGAPAGAQYNSIQGVGGSITASASKTTEAGIHQVTVHYDHCPDVTKDPETITPDTTDSYTISGIVSRSGGTLSTGTFTSSTAGTGTVEIKAIVDNTPCANQPTTVSVSGTYAFVEITTRTMASIPADRSRRKVGVNERVACLTNPNIPSTTWTVSGGGSMDGSFGGGSTFCAGAVSGTSVVTATFPGGGHCSVTFTVVQPSGAYLTRATQNVWHIYDTCSTGFKGVIHIQPSDVSFYGIQTQEQTVDGIGTGYYQGWNGKVHPLGSWIQIEQDNTAGGAYDYVNSGIAFAPYGEGAFSWNIPWNFRVTGSSGSGTTFTTLNHAQYSLPDGSVGLSKGGVYVQSSPSNPTSGY